jgi:hypothetical protein
MVVVVAGVMIGGQGSEGGRGGGGGVGAGMDIKLTSQ